MSDTSIVFSMWNRIQEIPISLPSILTMYDQATTELVIMDDNSTDGTKEVALSILKHYNWTNYQLIESPKKGAQYDVSQAAQTNLMVDRAQGKYLLMQSSEVAHVCPLVTQLQKYCTEKQPAFATVLNAPVREGLLLKNKPTLISGLSITAHTPEVVIFHAPELSYAAINDYPNHKVIFPDNSSLLYQTYCSILRPVPLFFCGMILKSDWQSLGGYKPKIPTDMVFWEDMTAAGFRFAFTRHIALHISHRAGR